MKKVYQKPCMSVGRLQLQTHLLEASQEVHSIDGGFFEYGGSDEDYFGDAR